LAWAVEHNQSTDRGCSAMNGGWTAMNKKLPTIFTLLLQEKSINFEAKDNQGRTALSRAAETGQFEVVRELSWELSWEESVGTDSSDNYGRTPLWWAAKSGHMSIVRELILKGADPNSEDQDGHTPLSCAVEGGHAKTIRCLLEKDTVTLHNLARKGSLTLLRSLVEAGGKVDIKDIRGRTPLHTATALSHVDIAEELLCCGANVNCKDTNGETPLHIALHSKQQNLIRLLLENSADTTDIMSKQWLDAFDSKSSDVVLELSQTPCRKISIQFLQERPIKMTSNQGPTRRLL
jgi:ankyrin repeat protein